MHGMALKSLEYFLLDSPDRPNPIGLHTVTVLEILDEQKIKIFPLEALNGSPVIEALNTFIRSSTDGLLIEKSATNR